MFFLPRWVFVTVQASSGCFEQGLLLDFPLQWLLLWQSLALEHAGFSSCGAWAQLL